jgi:glycosyltransferase involved in cell wall biosynthesis
MSEFLRLAHSAAETMHGVQFLLAGGPVFPDERAPYAIDVRRAHELGVTVTGHVADPATAYHAMDVFVHLGGPEGFGLTVLEALACGVPVVAYDWGAIPEVFGDLVRLVPPRDVGAAVRAVATLLEDTAKRNDLVRTGRRAAEQRFTMDNAALELRRVIASVAQ